MNIWKPSNQIQITLIISKLEYLKLYSCVQIMTIKNSEFKI